MSTARSARPDRFDDSAPVRITLLTPDPSGSPRTGGMLATDVEVTVGARLGDLRRELARLTGHPGWLEADRRLAVGHIPVDDEQPCGQPPLLAGSQLSIGRCARPADECAIDAHRHVAVVEGPDCGELRAVERTLAVGRHVPGTAALDWLALRDPTMSVRHAELAMRRGEVVVRDTGSRNGTTLVRSGSPRSLRPPRPAGPNRVAPTGEHRGRRERAVRGRWVRVRPGDRLRLGASVLEVRGAAPDDGPAPAAPPRATGPGLGSTTLTWLVPAASSAALAVSTGNRILVVCMLLAPAAVLAQGVAQHRRAAHATPASGRGDDVGRGDAAHGVPRAPRSLDQGVADELAPADLVTATLAALREGSRAAGGDPADDLAVIPGPTDPRADRQGRAIAVVGPRERALGVARSLALGLVGPRGTTELTVRCGGDVAAMWDWARWLTDRAAPLPARGAARSVVVADGEDTHAEIARWWHAAGATHDLVLVVRGLGTAPAWCDTVIEVGRGGATVLRAGRSRPIPLRAVGAGWALRQARRTAAVRSLTRDGTSGVDAIPETVALEDLPGVPPPDDTVIRGTWDATTPLGLRALLGSDGRGPVAVDIVREGPHALVAGTTGAGKSALLQTLVLSLALAHPPTRLAIALIDYKGGASFGACADLPHVVGQVTDLDGSLSTRALAGLRADQRRRELALAAAGVADLAELWTAHDAGTTCTLPPPRLLVVVDEFRAMADDHPDFLPGLLRLAAQGRSLGMHLVLATQRPAGAIGPDLRANISLRIALRVTDTAESLDVLEVPDAASIPVSAPGRALLRRGNAAPEWVQVAQVVTRDRRGGVAPALSWCARTGGWVPDAVGPTSGRGRLAPGVVVDDSGRFVDAVRRAARGLPLPTPPWLPELPERVHTGQLDALPAEPGVDDQRTLPLALADLPAEQRRAPLRWDPATGHLLVLGGPGSGRTTALRTVITGALDLALHVHLVDVDPPAPKPDDPTAGSATSSLGTVVGVDDPRRLARLLTHLTNHAPDGPRQLLVIDDVEAALDALTPIARGAGAERLLGLLRSGSARGVTVVAGARASARTMTHAPLFRARLVLSQADAVADVLAGIPTALAGARRRAGRAVYIGPGGPVECQIALADGPQPGSPRGTVGRRKPGFGAPGAEPLRLAPLPLHVPWSALADESGAGDPGIAADWARVAVGLGGDRAAVVRLDTGRGALVVGSPGSGRSNALAVLAAGLARAGRRVAVAAPAGLLRSVPGLRWSVEPDEVTTMLDELEVCPGPVTLIIDDLDDLDQVRPLVVERLARLVGPDGPGDIRLIASARTARAATAYREPLARLRSGRRGLVLDPHEVGSADVFGRPLEWQVDPAHAHTRGRGVLQDGPHVVAVQVAYARRDG